MNTAQNEMGRLKIVTCPSCVDKITVDMDRFLRYAKARMKQGIDTVAATECPLCGEKVPIPIPDEISI